MRHSLELLLPLAALCSVDAQTAPSAAPSPPASANSTADATSFAEGNSSIISSISSSISGLAFFDSNDNGIRDTDLDYPLDDIPVSLHSCNVSDAEFSGTNGSIAIAMAIAETVTDALGTYSFGSLGAGSYRISAADIASWYTFSSAWNGAANESGALLFPDAQSVIDPDTKSSLCFDVAEGVDRGAVDIAVRLDIPPINNPNTAPIAAAPSLAPTLSGTPGATPVAPSVAPTVNGTLPSTDASTVNSAAPTLSSPTNAPTNASTPTNAPTVPPSTAITGTPSPASASNDTDTDLLPGGNETIGDENATVSHNSTAPSEAPSLLPSLAPSYAPSEATSNETTTAVPTPTPIENETAEPVPSVAPSNQTTSVMPTPTPIKTQTHEPTLVVTTASPTDTATTASPTSSPRIGDLIGPVTTAGIRITITGISALENETAWGEYTASHIQNYFSMGFDVWDVAVDIAVSGQRPPAGARALAEPTRELQEPSVQVIYDQTTTYKTDTGKDTNYIITEPFQDSLDQARYIRYLADRSLFYAAVTAVSPVTVPGEEGSDIDADEVAAPAPSDQSSKTIPIIIGVCVAVGVVLILAGLYLVYKRKDRAEHHREAETTNVGTDMMSVRATRGTGVDIEAGTRQDGRSQGSSGMMMNQVSPQGSPSDDDNISSTASASYQPPPGETLEVIAPAGKLGVVVDIPPDRRGPPFVCSIRETSPLYGQLQIGDKIFAVDNEDVRKMSAIKVSKLLAQRSENSERVITVFREHEG